MKINFGDFTFSSKENFPVSECVNKHYGLSGYVSDRIHQVLVCSQDSYEIKIVIAKPCVCDNRFYWTNIAEDRNYGNVENSCWSNFDFVVGFIPVDDEYGMSLYHNIDVYRTSFEKMG